MFGIALNTLRRHWRLSSTDARLPDPAHEPVGPDPWPAVDDRIDGATLVRQAIADLRPAERELFCLVVWEQLSTAEAARTLEISAGTARAYLHHARITLRSNPGILRLLGELNTTKERT